MSKAYGCFVRPKNDERCQCHTDRLLASATLDRLRHNAYCMVLDGQSYRTPKLTPAAASAASRRLASAAK